MFKFGGWKASLKLGSSGRRREVYENGPDLTVGGAYRVHSEEFFRRGSLSDPPKKLTPSMVKLPPSTDALKTSKSANDLSNPYKLPLELRKSTPDISIDPRGGSTHDTDSSALHRNAKHKSTSKDKGSKKESKKQEKEQKAEKKRIAEEKKKEKLAMQEQAKQDKIRIQRDRQIAQQQARDVKGKKEQEKNSKKEPAPQAALPQASVTKTLATSASVPQGPNPTPPQRQRGNPLSQQSVNTQRTYSTNTLESSISRTSGPPPYSAAPKPPEKQPNKKDVTGNTSFGKPIENSSWDMISEHRQQMSRNPVASGSNTKQMTMDLKFSFDAAQSSDDRNNSEV